MAKSTKSKTQSIVEDNICDVTVSEEIAEAKKLVDRMARALGYELVATGDRYALERTAKEISVLSEVLERERWGPSAPARVNALVKERSAFASAVFHFTVALQRLVKSPLGTTCAEVAATDESFNRFRIWKMLDGMISADYEFKPCQIRREVVRDPVIFGNGRIYRDDGR
jgi:hypothetical protein